MLSEKIKYLMKQHKLNQEELAKIAGMTKNGLQLALNNNEFKSSTLKKIADALNVTVDFLLDETQTVFGPDLSIRGDKNKTIAGNHNVVNEPTAEYSNGTVKFLQEKVNMLEEMLKVKEKLIEEKERTINILLTNPKK